MYYTPQRRTSLCSDPYPEHAPESQWQSWAGVPSAQGLGVQGEKPRRQPLRHSIKPVSTPLALYPNTQPVAVRPNPLLTLVYVDLHPTPLPGPGPWGVGVRVINARTRV